MQNTHLCLMVLLLVALAACGSDEEPVSESPNNSSVNNSSVNNSSDNNASTNNFSENNASTNNSSKNNASTNNDITVEVPETYSFESRFKTSESSVSYSGQTMRHVLLADLTSTLVNLQSSIEGETFTPTEDGDVIAAFDFYFRFDSDSDGEDDIGFATDPEAKQQTYNEVSTGKDLVGKLAGNDTATDHKDWSTEFSGWSDDTIAQYGGATSSPEGLLTALFETLEENALGLADGVDRTGPGGEILPVTLTAEGQDLRQLAQKFLLGALVFHQGTDDYLDDDVDGKGLLSSNAQDEDKAYSKLEHSWDEAFGYFGAARDYDDYTDEEISGKGGRDGWSGGYHDTNTDNAIDFKSEYNFYLAVNAAKRDRGSSDAAKTDFTAEIFGAFRRGRTIIVNAGDDLTADELDSLRQERDIIALNWERVIAATVVHYINEVLVDMSTFDTANYGFANHAKHWSEMKGFALAFQFNPRSPLSDADFVAFHDLVGDAPTLAIAADADIETYRANLLEARDLLGTAYDFEAANLGNDQGEEGW